MTFKKLVDFKLDYAPQYHVSKYISQKSGLQLVHVNHSSSPLVQGYFAVATECPNDSGCPHTLEHLIFMGSKSYPYKGLLDTAGNLCMSSTNAWTATDQTVYTLTTAGWKGFKTLLPVYLDHLLFPTLTDEACITEVHHIDPETLTDKGVVYSEMDAIENQSWFVTMLEKQRLMFKEGSGYRSETGGLTENLRDLTNEEIREFHKNLYCPENLCIIVCGNVPEDELLSIVEDWDINLPVANPNHKRPFVDSKDSQISDKRPKTIESTIEFPELDESQSEILFSWVGCDFHDYIDDLGVSLMLDYFTESALAPFTKELVEIDDPFANSTDYWTDDFTKTIVNLGIHGVPTEKLTETRDKVLNILSTHKFDMKILRQVVDNGKWDYILRCEKNGDNIISQAVIADFIYGTKDGQSLERTLKTIEDYDILYSWPQEKWQTLLNNIFIANKSVIVLGKPSAKMYEKLDEEKEKLNNERKKIYDEKKRGDLLELLENAKSFNDKPIPTSLLEKFEIKDPAKTVNFITTKSITVLPSYKNNDLNDNLTKDILKSKPKDFPFFMHLENFPSQFIELHTLLNTTSIKDTKLLPFYHIFDELLSMPMKDSNGEILSFETVVSQLKSETVDSHITLGLQGSCPDLLDFRIRCKASEYKNAVKWIKHCLFDMIFDENRVSVLLENYLNSIVEVKREGNIMLESLTNRKFYTNRCMKKSADPLFVEEIIEDILEDIENGKFEKEILPRIETMRSQLRANFHKMHILILGDISKIEKEIYEPWYNLIRELENIPDNYDIKIPPVPRLLDSVSSLGKNPQNIAHVITTPASESSYMNILTSIPFDLDYHHEDYPAVSLVSEYLQCVEGPFWKGIRGSGLAYGANMVKMIESNAWAFSIYRGSDLVKCYEVGKDIISSYANGTNKFEPQLIQGAISSIINRMASMDKGYFEAGLYKFIDQFFSNRGTDFNKLFLERLNELTVKDLQDTIQKYFLNLFDSEKSVVFVSCHPSNLEIIQEFLEKEGFTVEVEELEDDEDEESEDSDKEEK
ncbi:hypothetical protein TBLA_0B08240 [Henningerozyma blattae CBS 6284]|uniref:Mitochondrial presequence protease n=1 Tax=Henningerozyma blattae (strain ATCC 34711 / CBS 6284 / DSM 70876 / NBRC 10599 / NRRL Y-10934 / UCD 77-7) TaxID=1071380 RepID=I2GZT7_HENB6|nr:hypothetical protein TBLA_0B08240 [Tetrapisispora blattae CBS 6284]CCH59639.1 hypothetical protein TBLA_0B08240 [Tetrapisispora blattae CBS 6284]